MRVESLIILLTLAGAADAMTVRSMGDYRRWQTVFDQSAPLTWNWEENAEAATVTVRPVLATRDEGGIVATRYGKAWTTEVLRTPADSRRGSCEITRPSALSNEVSLVEVSLVQTSNDVQVARATVQLAYPPSAIAVRTKASRDWWRVRVPRVSAFDAAWWGVSGSSGYEVLWATPAGPHSVVREFDGVGVVDEVVLKFGQPGLMLLLR